LLAKFIYKKKLKKNDIIENFSITSFSE